MREAFVFSTLRTAIHFLFWGGLAAGGLSACAPASAQNAAAGSAPIYQALEKGMACSDARSQAFEAYLKAYEGAPKLSLAGNLEIANPDMMAATDSRSLRFKNSLQKIHQLLTGEATSASVAMQVRNQKLSITSSNGELEAPVEAETDPVLHLIRLEMRSQIEPEYEALNQKLDAALTEAQAAASDLKLNCQTTPKVSEEDVTMSAHNGDAHYGAMWTMATAYQSCHVLQMPMVTKDVQDVQGVKRAVAIDEVGWGRAYTDVDLLKRTHYYHNGQTYSGNCANQNAKPLVYDYGGMPVANSGSSSLDLFKNNGGGPALGIDCSAYMGTSLAASGTLYKASSANRPTYTRFVSRDFINASQSGWSCFDNVKVTDSSTIQTGDIGAVHGHVVMVDQLGADPFGLRLITKASDCDSLDSKNFDFSVIQSSASKEHLGINRYVAKDFVETEKRMMDLFVGYAKQACKSKFDHVTRNPVTSAYGLIRHKSSANCQAPRVKLVHEECISSCASL